MMIVTLRQILSLAIILPIIPCLAAEPDTFKPRGVWVGQDGNDYCQTSSTLGPDDIQDLHIRLESLPANDPVDSALIRRVGGGEWAVNNQGGRFTWKGKLLQPESATTADIFLEPSHDEPGFSLDLELYFKSGRIEKFSLKCGRSNPNLFMPHAVLSARWLGQDDVDWTGLGPGVGPDGFADARLELSGLSTKLEIKSITIATATGTNWEYGLNPNRHFNAELRRDAKDKSRGVLFFSPNRDLTGEQLTVRIDYSIDRHTSTNLTAGFTDPKRAMPQPHKPAVQRGTLSVEWRGLESSAVVGPGNFYLVASGVPPAQEIRAAGLSDRYGGLWIWRRQPDVPFYPAPNAGDPPARPMALIRENSGDAEFYFLPNRNELNTLMVLRLLLADGSTVFQRFTGGACFPQMCGPIPAFEKIEARPGDDLNALAQKFGRIHLGPGQYLIDKPLALAQPIAITGDSNAVLHFSQKAGEPPWSGAILIGASRVALRGFSVRFDDDFRWAISGPGGAALIRTFDPPGSHDPKVNITLANLDIQSSAVTAPADPAKPVEAPYLTRLSAAESGEIVSNRFCGGTVDIANGPWRIVDNEHRGAMPGTIAWDAFGGHWLHDFTLENNRVHTEPGGGKIWRFLSMNQLGEHLLIRSNDVSGVGMRDNDVIPNPNAPEILLTESYRLYFEGRPAAISADGSVLQIPVVMQGAVRAGSIVSILDGPHAGEWFVLAQPLSPLEFLMADPLPPGDYNISIAHGYVDTVIEGNRIDVRGGKSAIIDLAGNHWGVKVINNHTLGGGDALLLQSTPTEDPFIWGWSHTPFLGFTCSGNVVEDSVRGAAIDVDANRYTKSIGVRTYLSGKFENNLIRWSAKPPVAALRETNVVRIGLHSGDDSMQMKIQLKGNRFDEPAGQTSPATLSIHAASVNGTTITNRQDSLQRVQR